MNFIKSHWRQIALLIAVIISYLLVPVDLIWAFAWSVIGILLLRQSITLFDRYWSRKGREVSLSNFMAAASEDNKVKIYASIIIGVAFIIGCAIGL